MNHQDTQWINTARAVAVVAVIFLHITVPLVNQFDGASASWWAANIINGSARFCVPVFLMISGVLLLGKDYALTTFLKKRVVRVVLPFLLWSVIYFLFKSDLTQDLKSILLQFIKAMKSGVEFHLWYVYMILGVYLFVPIINRWTRTAPKKEIYYFLSIWLLITFIGLPGFNKLFTRIDFRYFSGFIGYLVLGYGLTKANISENKRLFLLLLLAGNILTIVLSYFISASQGKFDGMFYHYLTPNVILSSVGLFLWIKNTTIHHPLVAKGIAVISKYSYGIYLSHIFSLGLMSQLGLTINIENTIFYVVTNSIICLLLSLLITFLISKIPYGKYVSG